MIEQKEHETRITACFPPIALPLAHEVYRAIRDYSSAASNFLSGMSIQFMGLDMVYIVDSAKKFRALDLTRFESPMVLYESKLKKQHAKKDD